MKRRNTAPLPDAAPKQHKSTRGRYTDLRQQYLRAFQIYMEKPNLIPQLNPKQYLSALPLEQLPAGVYNTKGSGRRVSGCLQVR